MVKTTKARKSRRLRLPMAVMAAVLALPSAMQAQDEEEIQEQPTERIQVVGSHIKRIDMEGVSPVITISRDDIDASGVNTVSELLKNFTGSSFGARTSTAGNAASGAETISLKGLGATRTLVLLDGRRLTKDPLLQAPDLSLIPTAAIERVEILNEGASALYGSDAVGGVVNIITRKDYQGAEVFARQSWTSQKGGETASAGWVGGTSSDRSSFVGVITYSEQENIRSADRAGERGRTSSIGAPGSYIDADGNSQAFPNCPPEMVVDLGNGASRCEYDFTKVADRRPEVKRWSSLFNYRYDFHPNVSFHTSFGMTHARTRDQYAPSPSRGLTMSAEAAQDLNLPNQPEGDLTFNYRWESLGPRQFRQEVNGFNISTGFEGLLANRFDWDVYVTRSRSGRNTMTTSGVAIKDKLEEAIASGEINPFAEDPAEQGDVNPYRYKPFSKQTSVRTQVDAKIAGELFALGDGAVNFALGGSTSAEEYSIKYDNLTLNRNVTDGIGGEADGSREVNSAFVEFSLNPLQALELQLAGRFDDYSDFGSTINPKLAFRYQLLDSMLFRGSWGTGFKAPDLDQLYAGPSNGFPTFFDPIACNATGLDVDCRRQQHEVVQRGNPDLEEETFNAYNFGFVFQPTTDLNLALDYNSIILEGVIGSDSFLEGIGKALEAGIDVADYGVDIERDANQRIVIVRTPNLNVAKQEVQSLTLDLNYRLTTGIGRFRFSSVHTQLLSFKEEPFPGLGLEQLLNKETRPALRNNTSVNWSSTNNVHRVLVLARTIGAYDGIEVGGKKEAMPSNTEFDLNYALLLPWNGTVELGAVNVFNEPYPIDPNANLVNIDLYNITGRSYYAGYTQRF
ncbi:MAG: TonB-dependent receptor plug domain-containing protein [Oligoflexus sp.]